MKLNINITLITWSKWFVSATGALALALLIMVNNQSLEIGLLTFILTLNFLVAVVVGLRKN